MRSARSLGLFAAALAALLAAGGCGSADETRFDSLPGPLRTVDLAAAARLEETPLSEDEWATLEAMHDRYLQDFDAVRRDTLAPLARDVRDAREAGAGPGLGEDGAALARFGKRTAAALSRIKSLDDRLASDIADAFRARAAFVDRLSQRRAIDRAARVIRGNSSGDREDEREILDLEDVIDRCGLPAGDRRRVEPVLADYRRELARAAEAAAEEWLEHPARLLAMREAAGVGPLRLQQLQEAVNPPSGNAAQEDRDALDAAVNELERVRLRAGTARARAYEAIDSAARRALESVCAALPEEAAARLREADERARTGDDGYTDFVRRNADAIRCHPAVREGRAPRTARALEKLRDAVAEASRWRIEACRASFAARGAGLAAPVDERRSKELAGKVTAAQEELDAAARAECGEGGLLQGLSELGGLTAEEAVERLAPSIGRRDAAWVVGRCPRSMFRSPRAAEDFDFDESLSIAEQLLLAPGMDHAAFRRAARAMGARDDDPLVEQLWERHQARLAGLEEQQRAHMKLLEKDALEAARHGEDHPDRLERAVASYLQALIVADGERREADEALFEEIAIALSIRADDPRFVLARAVSAARRASVPWKRFRQSWLLGPLWEADADPLSMALEEGDEARRTAAVIAMAPFAERLRESADAARRAGLEALRDLLIAGVREAAAGRRIGRPEDLRDAPSMRPALERVREAAAARRRAQRESVEAVTKADPALGAELMRGWVHATCPEFFVDGAAWRTASDFAEAGPAPDRGDGASAMLRAAVDRWLIIDDDLVRRLAEWQDSARAEPAPASALDLARSSALDPALAAMRTLRDESAWRLLRIAATSAGRPADDRMPDEDGRGGSPRTVAWGPP